MAPQKKASNLNLMLLFIIPIFTFEVLITKGAKRKLKWNIVLKEIVLRWNAVSCSNTKHPALGNFYRSVLKTIRVVSTKKTLTVLRFTNYLSIHYSLHISESRHVECYFSQTCVLAEEREYQILCVTFTFWLNVPCKLIVGGAMATKTPHGKSLCLSLSLSVSVSVSLSLSLSLSFSLFELRLWKPKK